MLMKLDASWLIFAVVTVTMLSYLFSAGLHALLRDAGFGPLGNTGIVTVGFFGAIQAVNVHGTRFGSLLEATLAGLVGSFVLLLLLVMLKLVLNRLI